MKKNVGERFSSSREKYDRGLSNVGGWMIDLTIYVFSGQLRFAKIAYFEHFVRDVQLHGTLTPSADLIGTSRFGLSYYRRRGTHCRRQILQPAVGFDADFDTPNVMMRKDSNAMNKLIRCWLSRRDID